MLDELVKERGLDLDLRDGLLLIRTDEKGHIHPHVLRLGLMTEGRLEGAIMSVYSEIVRHRVRLANEVIANAKLGGTAA